VNFALQGLLIAVQQVAWHVRGFAVAQTRLPLSQLLSQAPVWPYKGWAVGQHGGPTMQTQAESVSGVARAATRDTTAHDASHPILQCDARPSSQPQPRPHHLKTTLPSQLQVRGAGCRRSITTCQSLWRTTLPWHHLRPSALPQKQRLDRAHREPPRVRPLPLRQGQGSARYKPLQARIPRISKTPAKTQPWNQQQSSVVQKLCCQPRRCHPPVLSSSSSQGVQVTQRHVQREPNSSRRW
jgi:hypothetical protein